ncbi:MAG: molybdenum cofactor guanylyltransferase [Gemmatimonadota bacterium]
MISRSSILILAGGASRRMGRDKAFLELGDRALLERVLEGPGAPFRDLVLAVDRPERYDDALRRYGWIRQDVRARGRGGARASSAWQTYHREPRHLRVVPDLRPGSGPLAGLEAGLEAARSESCWVQACDLPFVTADVGERLLRELALAGAAARPVHAATTAGSSPAVQAVVPRLLGRPQPLCAAYSREAARAAAVHCLEAGLASMASLLEQLRVRCLEASKLGVSGDAEVLFLNLNRPRDWERARRLLRER